MREECKHYETRTYPTGDTVRKCNLDLAPDAPWRCPSDCERFEIRLVGGDWVVGSLATPPPPPEPGGLDDGSAAAVLDAAEDILNAVGPDIVDEMHPNQGRTSRWWHRFRRRRRR